jgi:hypothetical protein
MFQSPIKISKIIFGFPLVFLPVSYRNSATPKLKSTLGDLSITEKQAELLGCGTGSRLSPHLENCCLRLSANVAYESASKDIKYITGVTVPSKTQLILVHAQEFNKPVATLDITELSVDGGKARLITPFMRKI